MSKFDKAVKKAARRAAKARVTGGPSAELEARIAGAVDPMDERQARQQLAAAKMIVEENRRARSTSALSRMQKGLGVPLFTNSRALPDDRQVRGV